MKTTLIAILMLCCCAAGAQDHPYEKLPFEVVSAATNTYPPPLPSVPFEVPTNYYALGSNDMMSVYTNILITNEVCIRMWGISNMTMTTRIVTNITSGDNSMPFCWTTRVAKDRPDHWQNGAHTATEKWQRTVIKRVHTLTFDWRGKRRTVTDEEIISNKKRKWKLKKKWEESKE